MNKSKSAQGLSLNTIIIGIIVLIVLLVLVAAFSGFFGKKFMPNFAEATEKKCDNIKDECDELTEEEIFGNFGKDFPTDKRCCKKMAESCEEFSQELYCLDKCPTGYTLYDKTQDGLPLLCDPPSLKCCLSSAPFP